MMSGVPQGSLLGPLIFLILIGDIDASVVKAVVRSFADDTHAPPKQSDQSNIHLYFKKTLIESMIGQTMPIWNSMT